jgi:Delta3-Delta2-enoyl-CoA isomerase
VYERGSCPFFQPFLVFLFHSCRIQVDFGAPWPTSFAAILRAKVGTAVLHRRIALEGHRFSPKEALASGLLDFIVEGKTTDVLKKAEQVADLVGPKASAGVWGVIKLDIYRDALEGIRAQYRVRNSETEELAAKYKL